MAKDDSYLMRDVCGNCRLWHRLDDGRQRPAKDVVGECCLHPPQIVDVEEGTNNPIQTRPLVQAREFCGSHKRELH